MLSELNGKLGEGEGEGAGGGVRQGMGTQTREHSIDTIISLISYTLYLIP